MALLHASVANRWRCVKLVASHPCDACATRVKRIFIDRADRVHEATETTECVWKHKQCMEQCETTIWLQSIRWNTRLNCAYKHSGYGFSFSTECGTVDRVWHVQIFSFVVVFFFKTNPVFCACFLVSSIAVHIGTISVYNKKIKTFGITVRHLIKIGEYLSIEWTLNTQIWSSKVIK